MANQHPIAGKLPSTQEVVFAGTTELATLIQARQLSAVEVLEAHLAQIARHNPALNAVAILDEEGARQRAREADAALARGEVWGPLHGVPFILKDAHCTAGMRTTVGFPPFADFVPQEDSTVAARLKAAGAILMGKSNVHIMLGDPLQSVNPLFGRTNNPWDTTRTPGGSSGGAAAAVAAGLSPFDIGTDLAGSIRIPAHFCGLFGLKPTEHRVPLAGLIPNPGDMPPSVRLMSCIGPLARTPEDLALLYAIIAGADSRDSDVPPVPVERVATIELKGLRVAVAANFPGFPLATELRQAVEDLARQLTPFCATVEEATFPPLDFYSDLASAGELIGMMVGAAQPQGDEPPPTFPHYLELLQRRDRSILAWEQFFAQWDVLLCPPAMLTAFPHCEPGTPLSVDGEETTYWLGNAHTILFNYSGHPAVTLPYTRNGAGMPIGMQLVSKRWDEARLLAITKAVTAITAGFQRPPGY
jgi:amidase